MKNMIILAAALWLALTPGWPATVLGMQDEVTTIEGIVTNALTGEPVPDATVNLIIGNPSTRPSHTLTTASDGKFSIKGVAPGPYRVTVSRRGFITPRGFEQSNVGDFAGYGRVFTIAAGGAGQNFIRLSLIRTATLSGKVLDERGEPRSSLTVLLYEKGYDSNGRSRLVETMRSRTLTDDRGEYEVAGLRPGEYYVRVEGGTPPIPTAFYPGVVSQDQAVPVFVGAGAEVGGIDIKLRAADLFSIRLKILSASPFASVDFDIHDLYQPVTADLGGGAYVLSKVPRGDQRVNIVLYSSKPTRMYTHSVDVQVVEKDVDLGTVNVDSQVSLTGRVIVPAGVPLPRAAGLYRIDGYGIPLSSIVKEDGTFLFEKVSRGRYNVRVPGAADLFVRSVRYASQEVLGTGLVVDGIPAGPIEVIVDRPGATIEGIVRNSRSEPVAFGRVVLVPDVSRRGNPELFLTEVTDEGGRFSISAVPPGSYSALAWQYTPPNAYKNAEFLSGFLRRAVPVDVKGAVTAAIEVEAVESPDVK